MNNVANVVAGRPKATGGGYSGPLGTALPTDAVTTLNAGLTSFGFLGDAGLVETIGRTTETIRAWGGDVIKVVQTEFGATYAFTLVEELSAKTNQEVYGDDNVVTTAANATHGNQLAVAIKSAPLPHKVYTFEVADGPAVVRVVIPDGQITTVGDVSYVDANVIARPVTVTAYPDSEGNCAFKYTDDGQLTA